jgi:hypothetical protein
MNKFVKLMQAVHEGCFMHKSDLAWNEALEVCAAPSLVSEHVAGSWHRLQGYN